MSKATILIVEDEAIVAADLAGMLRRLGYEISATTGRGEEATSLAREHRPDLVLMDIRLAGAMDGVEAAEIIHREFDLPVIFLTAHSDHATLERAKLSEPFGYLLKPFEELGLETHIEMALYKHRAERKLRQAYDELELRVQERTRELKEAEEGLREMNETLEQRVSERTAELSAVNASLRDARRAALNVMEDTDAARRQAEEANANLQREAAERKQAEEALRRAHDELEQRVAERTEELALAINVLQEEIVEREKADKNLQRLNRLYAVLSETDQAIVRATDRDSLFRDFCRIAVEDGGFMLSWVGLVDAETGLVKMAATHGATGYLDDIRISTNDEPAGEGPTGKSIREGTYYISNDFLNDPCTRPWHERGRAYGIRSSASIVLKNDEEVIGAFTLYADEKDFFDQQQVKLIRQMAMDVSFALGNLERETRLRESEEKFRTLFEESKDVIFIMDADGKLLDFNPAATDLFGHTREELLALDITYDLYRDPVEREYFRQTLFAQGFVKDYELHMKKKNGEALHVLSTTSVIHDENGKIVGYRGIIHDVTGRKRLEQQLLQSQKMESIGLLAGGVAHDFNNLLTAISGYSQIIQEQFAAKDEMLAMCIEQVMGATERAVDLTRNLLAFSRKQIINPQPVQVNGLVISVGKLLTRFIGEDIELETQLVDKELTVMADKGQIDQVLVNLATNARDAMPQGGRLLIRTDRAELDRKTAQRYDLDKGGRYALISVSDSGHGMDKETMARIFEPFFTTKETGKGTGLGLSIIYGIVKQHNGTITVESEPDKGSTFTIYLPLIEAVADEAQKEEVSPVSGGIETILLAEDDPMVRKYMHKILVMAGYSLITAKNGEEAVEQFRENRDRIALVLCDVVMPKKNGKEVYDEIRAMDPHVRFLFTSGYNNEIIHTKGILLEEIELIEKPVNRQVLLAKLREMLDA